MIRSFIAIAIADDIRARLKQAQATMAPAAPGVKWVETANIHLTLRFLGDVTDETALAVEDAMRHAAAGIAPFEMHLCGVGAFPTPQRANVVWAGVEKAEPLVLLFDRLDARLRTLDVKQEGRGFEPHVTIGRVKDAKGAQGLPRALHESQAADFGRMTVSELALMKSELTPAGPIYTALEKVPLI